MRKIFFTKYNVNFFSTFLVILALVFSSTNLAHASKIGVPPNFIPGTGLSRGLVGWWTMDGKDTTLPAPVVTYITSGSTWAVPSDWNNSNNTIEVIGGGGGGNGSNTAGGGNGGTAGSGGAYAKVVNLSLTPSSSVNIGVGTGGSGGARDTKGGAGGDTWFNATSLANAVTNGSSVSVAAAGAAQSAALYGTAGTSGQASASVGTTKYSGGTGGAAAIFNDHGGGGGGAAGPNGNGGAGGDGGSSTFGGGGGGSGGGAAGSVGGSNLGGNGGANYTASQAGGTGGVNDGPAGTGDNRGASGAAGGGYGVYGSETANGGTGGSGQEWDSTHGSGGGGGGAGRGNAGNADGGNAGSYGAGGGGGSDSATDGVGGNGSQGIIVVTYTPAAGTTLDKSGNGNTGTLTNMIQTTGPAAGKIGQALNFDGTDDYVNAGATSALNGATLVTVSAWVNFDDLVEHGSGSGVPAWQNIFQRGSSGEINGYILNFGLYEDSKIIVDVQDTTTLSHVQAFSASTVAANKWYHVAFVADTSQLTVYVNGVAGTPVSYNGMEPLVTGGTLYYNRVNLGAAMYSSDTASIFLKGKLDDVRVYTRALSTTEIGQLYNLSATKFGISPTKSLTSGLVGYWTFDGKDVPNGRANDVSGNGNHGNLVNIATSTFYIPGKIGQGFNFDGSDDYVDIPSLSAPTDKTYSLWIKAFSLPATFNTLLEFGNDSPWFGALSNNTISLYNGNPSTSGTIALNTWYHIAYTSDSTSNVSKIYINGVQDATTGIANTQTGSGLGIGRHTGESSFNGVIDDVRVYNRALSAIEINQLYKLGASAKQSSSPTVTSTSCTVGLSCGLVGYWTFDGKDTPWTSSTAATTIDKSGNGNTGTLTNMAQATSPIAGKIGQGLSFDGVNDYVAIPTNVSLSGTQKASVSLWLNQPSYTVGSAQVVFESTINFNNESTGFIMSTSDTVTGCSTNQVITAVAGDVSYNIQCYSPPTANQWHHFVAVYDKADASSEGNLYIDGVLQSKTQSGYIANNTNNFGDKPFYIGARSGGTAPMQGKIDDIRIYNRALSATEVSQLYSIGR